MCNDDKPCICDNCKQPSQQIDITGKCEHCGFRPTDPDRQPTPAEEYPEAEEVDPIHTLLRDKYPSDEGRGGIPWRDQ